MATVLVTGATGLLGANTIVELINSGYFVKALVRDKSKFVLQHHDNIELIEGNLSDPFCLENATRGCTYIVHAAAETKQGLNRYADYYKINVEYANLLYQSAVKNRVKRIIHVGTSNVFGFGDLHNPGNENNTASSPFSDSLYVKSKIASQNLALSFSDKLEVVAVNPTFLIGPFDQKPSSGQIIFRGYHKRVILYPPGGKNFVDVRDVAKAIVAAITLGKNKESYILSGENLTYKEFFERLNRLSTKKSFLLKIPRAVLISMGVLGDMLTMLGVNTVFTKTNMKILCAKNYYSNSKARNELNVEFASIDDAITDAIIWFKSKGMLNN